MSDVTRFDREVNKARTIAIKECTDYLAMSQNRVFSDLGRHSAATKRKYCEKVREAARTEHDVHKFRGILLDALKYLDDDGHNLTDLRKPLEALDAAIRDYAVTVFKNTY